MQRFKNTLYIFLLSPLMGFAQGNYDHSSFLKDVQEPNAAVFLPAPPDSSSVSFLNDIHRYEWGKSQRKTSLGKKAKFDAYWQTDSIMVGFAPYLGFTVTRKDMPQTFKLLSMVCEDAENGVRGAKKKYMRKRPYVQFGEHPADRTQEDELRNTGSYPSAHSARGWSCALVLSELLPERANGILLRGFDYGESRVITGYHYQSDVDAARLAASAVVARLHADNNFQRQLDLARKEIKAIKDNVKTMRVVTVGKLQKQVQESYQGMSIYKDWLVSVQNAGYARIYHLPDMKPVTETFKLGSHTVFNHANVACFGNEKYAATDDLPLLYVSQCKRDTTNGNYCVCYVERLSLNGSSQLVQTINLRDVEHYYGNALQWTIDREHNTLIGFGNTKDNTIHGNRFRIIRFHLPKLSDGKQVTLDMKDAIDNVILQDYDSRYPSIVVGQGACYRDGCLYMPTGFGSLMQSSVVYVYDVNKRRLRSIIDLQSQLPKEMEDIDFYHGDMLIQCNGGAGIIKLVAGSVPQQ